MRDRDLTQQVTAELLGVSRSYLTRVLAYERAPSLTLAIGARNAFGIDPALFDLGHVSTVTMSASAAKRRVRAASKVPSRGARPGGRAVAAS